MWSASRFLIVPFFLCSAGVQAGAGAAAAQRAGEGQEEAGGRRQIQPAECGRDGEEQEWTGGAHQEVRGTVQTDATNQEVIIR